ncbi:ATP-binding cassette domain-containing protein [Cereibacter sp. SYSU M97828]|nr:ATP-binding cassette domain-containing protein [Cereibacter flavus]
MLTIAHLSVSFRRYRGFRQVEVPALSGIDLHVAAGEVVGVIGASGAGKSLLAHAILGVLPPNAILRGRIDACAAGLVPQQVSHLDPLARIGRQVRWAGGSAPDALAPLYPHQLSGGMARQAMLAIALARQPRLLVADEPTAGLDPDAGAGVLDGLRRHAVGGGAVLLISHDLNAALRICNRVVLLDEGRVRGIEDARAFCGDGAGLSPHARALWHALPENGFHA